MGIRRLEGEPALRREIGAVGIAAVTINIVMGSGLFVLPAAIAILGPWAPAALVACALIMGAVTLCFAEASSRVPTSGGAYGFVREALGTTAATVVGGLLWLSGVCAGAAILAAAIDQLAPFAPWASGPLLRVTLLLAACSAFALVAIAGTRQSTQAVELTMTLKLAPILLFLGLAAFAPSAAASPVPLVAPGNVGPTLILGIYLFAGVETAVLVNGEVRNPTRTLPIGLLAAVALFTVIAIATQLTASRALGNQLVQSNAPLVAAAIRIGPAWLPALIAGAAIVSMLGCAGGLAIALPRTLFAFANDGVLPARLGRVHPIRRTPTAAIVFHGSIVALLAVTGEFAPLAAASALASMVVYVFGCWSVLVLRRRGVAKAGPVIAWRIVPAAAVLAIIANVLVIVSASWSELAALGAASVILVGLDRWRRLSADHEDSR